MKDSSKEIQDVESYIAGFPDSTQKKLQQLRATILKAVPKANEVISYQMPAYKLNGVLVYFAGYARHIGFYPTASGIANFKDELSGYKFAKGSIQFPLDEPLPIKLVTQIVKFRAMENVQKAERKRAKK